MKHKHAEIIALWVQGLPIQYQSPTTDEWLDVPDVNTLGEGNNYLEPSPLHPEYDYYENWRVKPV